MMRLVTQLLKSRSFLLLQSECYIQNVAEFGRKNCRPFASSPRHDPLARRPNKVCDPYGQGGKPLSRQEAQSLLATIEDGWKLVPEEEVSEGPPTSLARDFYHENFLEASQFVTKIAAIGHVNNHYPSILLERRLLSKAWQVVTRVECRTPTLEGLSYNDFHLAMVSRAFDDVVAFRKPNLIPFFLMLQQVDIEVARPEVKKLLLSEEESQRKIT